MKYTAIDIGANAVKTVLLEVSDGGMRVVEHTLIPLERDSIEVGEGKVVGALREALKRTKGKIVLASIPRSSVVVREVSNLPRARDEDSLRRAVEMQVLPDMPFPMEEAVGDIQNVVESEGRISLQFVAVRSDEVQKLMSLLEEADVKPDMLIPSVFATALVAIKRAKEEANQSPIVFLDVGAGRTDMGIILAGRLAFSRSFPVGGDMLTASIARKLEVEFQEAERIKLEKAYLPSSELSLPGESEEEVEGEIETYHEAVRDAVRSWASRLTLEVERSIQAFLGGMIGESRISPSQIWLCGGGAKLRGLDGYLRDKLGIQVMRWNPAETVPGGEAIGGDGDLFALPIGLATAAAEGIKLANLIPVEEKERRQKRRFLSKVILYAATAVLGIALIGSGITMWDNHLESRLAEVDSQLTEMQKASQQSRSLLLRNLAMLDLMSPTVSPLDVLRELSLMFPIEQRTQIAFTSFFLDKNGKVTISVEANSHDVISEAIRKLDRSPLFEEVKQGQIASVEKNKRQILQVQITFRLSPKAAEIIAQPGALQVAEAGR
jgi:type IV pilus assembly protein PilM